MASVRRKTVGPLSADANRLGADIPNDGEANDEREVGVETLWIEF